MRVENVIKGEAVSRGVRLHELAEALGVSSWSLSRSFTGHRDMRTSEVNAAANFFGIDVATLWRRAEENGTSKEQQEK